MLLSTIVFLNIEGGSSVPAPDTYFTWIRMSFWKTVSLMPKGNYAETERLCRRIQGIMMTFSRMEIDDLVHQIYATHGQDDYWIGMRKEIDGRIYWNDGSLVPRHQFNIAQTTNTNNFNSLRTQRDSAQCGYLTVNTRSGTPSQPLMRGTSYEIDFIDCEKTKKGLCEEGSNRIWDANKIIAVTALCVSTMCLFILMSVVLKWYCCRAHNNYIMRSKRNGSTLPKNSTEI